MILRTCFSNHWSQLALSTPFIRVNMDIEVLACVLLIIGTIVSTTMAVLSRLTHLDVRLAELSVRTANYESRITRLERIEEGCKK
jgi:hypothetical protein